MTHKRSIHYTQFVVHFVVHLICSTKWSQFASYFGFWSNLPQKNFICYSGIVKKYTGAISVDSQSSTVEVVNVEIIAL